jgi:hypothetical protein
VGRVSFVDVELRYVPTDRPNLWRRRALVWRIERRDGFDVRRSLIDVDTGELLDDVYVDERRRFELLVVELDDAGAIVDTGRRESRGRIVSQELTRRAPNGAASPHARSSVRRPGTPPPDAERAVFAPHARSAPAGLRRARRRSAGFSGRVVA